MCGSFWTILQLAMPLARSSVIITLSLRISWVALSMCVLSCLFKWIGPWGWLAVYTNWLGPVGPSMVGFMARWPQAKYRTQPVLFTHICGPHCHVGKWVASQYLHFYLWCLLLTIGVLHRGFPYLPAIIYVFGILSSLGGVIGGMTMSISLFSDLLSLCTVHIYVCYVIANTVYARVLSTARSLWNLFRGERCVILTRCTFIKFRVLGKRYNVLRNRTDSWEYDTDQLLFGTILFTLLAFLFPTVLAYYSLFALVRLRSTR